MMGDSRGLSASRAGHAARTHGLAIALVLAGALTACDRDPEPDAYGNFEATEVVVSAETAGRLLRFAVEEGDTVRTGAAVATIDTAQLALEARQLAAQRAAAGSRGTEVSRQEDALAVQHAVARRSWERQRRLYAESAATVQQLDQAERDYKVLDRQLAGARAQRRTVGEDSASTDARLAQVRDRLARSTVASPITGTVLATYAERGEVVQAGQPLFRVAALDTLVLRAYVSQPQLSSLRLGQRVTVRVDRADGQRLALPGVVSWVSSSAEFTPTPVQTRDERADLVYAVKIRVANPNGALKIGMPADVVWGATARPQEREG